MEQISPQNPFLNEVLQHPDDDTPRLIYADWLDERGDPRGEFIRLQCELARANDLDPAYFDLVDRTEELLQEFGEQWAGELKQDVRKAAFHRGFIDTITVRARAFVNGADEMLQSTPVHWLRFNYVKGYGAKLATMPAFRRIRFLDLSRLTIQQEDLLQILTSKNLSGLEALNLAYQKLPFDGSVGRALRDLPSRLKLKELDVRGGEYSNDFVESLVGGDGFPSLVRLAIGVTFGGQKLTGVGRLQVAELNSLRISGRLSSADCNSLANLPLSHLKQLNLSSTCIPAKGIDRLSEHGAFDEIEELDLASCDLGMRGAHALLRGQQLQHCKKLNLAGNYQLSTSGEMAQFIRLLAGHAPMKNLQRLALTGLRQGEWQDLAPSDCSRNLQSLIVDRPVITTEDARAITNSCLTRSLRKLGLVEFQMDSAAVDQLCSEAYPKLMDLTLHGGFAGFAPPPVPPEACLVRLIQSGAFPNLRTLTLNHLDLTCEALEAIASGPFPELRTLYFHENRTTNETVRKVLTSDQLPKLKFFSLSGTKGMHNRPKLVAEFGRRIRV